VDLGVMEEDLRTLQRGTTGGKVPREEKMFTFHSILDE
jgi:hypothetical protein